MGATPDTAIWNTLYQIAAILAANQLESEGDIAGDQLLLIPRKRA